MTINPRKLAEAITAGLFTSGSTGKPKAERLVLWRDSDQRTLGGWSQKPMTDYIEKKIREAIQ